MYTIKLANSFIQEGAQITSRRVYERLHKDLRSLETSDFGLRKAPIVLIDQYGSHLRTIVISSFYLFYRVNEKEDTIDVLHLVYARRGLGSWVATDQLITKQKLPAV